MRNVGLKKPILKVKKNTLNQTFENIADEEMMDGQMDNNA